jgi:hypothetical protein
MNNTQYNEDDDDFAVRSTIGFPYIFPLSLSHSNFPSTEKILNDAGLPVGSLVTPFIPLADRSHCTINLSFYQYLSIISNINISINIYYIKGTKDLPKFIEAHHHIARCGTCNAYINPFCDIVGIRWACCICGNRNVFPRTMKRYQFDSKNDYVSI